MICHDHVTKFCDLRQRPIPCHILVQPVDNNNEDLFMTLTTAGNNSVMTHDDTNNHVTTLTYDDTQCKNRDIMIDVFVDRVYYYQDRSKNKVYLNINEFMGVQLVLKTAWASCMQYLLKPMSNVWLLL